MDEMDTGRHDMVTKTKDSQTKNETKGRAIQKGALAHDYLVNSTRKESGGRGRGAIEATRGSHEA